MIIDRLYSKVPFLTEYIENANHATLMLKLVTSQVYQLYCGADWRAWGGLVASFKIPFMSS